MDQSSAMSECTRKWWQFSVIAGAVIAVLLWLFVYSFLPSLVVGIVVAVMGGLVLSKVKCASEAETPAAKSSVMSQAAAAPAATAKAPEPAVAPVADAPEVKTEAPPVAAKAPAAKKAAPKAAKAKTTGAKAAPKKAAPKKAAPKKAAAKKAPAKAAPAKAATAKGPAASARAPVAADGKPEMLTAARAGGADDLKLLKGVGPKLEGTLNELGVYHFDQVAGWRKKEIEWVDDRLKFKGRIERDEWIKQAKVLAKGGETEFSKRNKKP